MIAEQVWSNYRGNLDWLRARTILLVRAGSHAYAAAKREWDRYREWQRSRNPERAEFVSWFRPNC